MTKLEQLHLFLKFHYAAWGAAKGAIWEDYSNDGAYGEYAVERVCRNILNGDYTLTEEEVKMLRVVADPSPIVAGMTDQQWAENVATTPEPADIQWTLMNLLRRLGYNKTADAWAQRAEPRMADPKPG